MSRLRRPVHGFLMFVLLAGITQAQEITFRDPLAIRGEDPATNLRFWAGWDGESAQWFQLESDSVAIRVRLGNGPGPRWFVIESQGAGLAGPGRLTASDTAALQRLMASLRPMNSPLEGGFARVVNLLASWPAKLPVAGSLRDGILEAPGGRWRASGSTENIVDICGKMNQLHRGTYPVFLIPRRFEAVVGPYPWTGGDCQGRCGAGCPGDGPPNNSVFAFGQDCFNHDACVRDQGLVDPDCDLIFPRTLDDFLYGPSCQKDNADITINGQDGPVDVTVSDRIEIRVSLIDVPAVRRVDYWLYAQTASGIFWLDSNGNWVLGGQPIAARTGALVEVFDRSVYEGPLPPEFLLGLGTFYLSLDLVPDGVFSKRQFEDAIDVRVVN